MKVYTKKGDQGQTSLIGGTRVDKSHDRLEAYGTVDELNSWIGLLRDQKIKGEHITILLEIQDRLFTIGSLLAQDPEKAKMQLPEVRNEDIFRLEEEIDRLETNLPELRTFVLPGGNTTVSYCHIARTICRRAERRINALNSDSEVQPVIMTYMNRLSDYLFVLSRALTQELNATETPWEPRM